MIEMFDVKNERVFLKKIEIPEIRLEDLFVGARVTILSRVLKVTDYGDVRTKNAFEKHRAKTFAMIKPHAYSNIGKIIDSICSNGFEINKLKMSKFSADTAAGFYAEHVGKSFFPNLSNAMTSDVCIGLELISKDAITRWREFIGPTNTAVAKTQAPNSIRAKFGVDGTCNAVHGSDSIASV